MTEKMYVSFRDALNTVFPGKVVTEHDLVLLEQRWNFKAAEKWSSRRRPPRQEVPDGPITLPISDAVCVVVSVVREWQVEEQQKAFKALEARLVDLRVFDDSDGL